MIHYNTREDICQFLLIECIYPEGKKKSGLIPGKMRTLRKNTELTKAIFSFTEHCESDDLSERIYWLIHGLTEYPTSCPQCGGAIKGFCGYNAGYAHEFCSNKCQALHHVDSNRKKRAINREDITKRTLATKLERYGSSSYNNDAKRRKTLLETRGVEHEMQDPEYFDRRKRYKRHQYTLPSGKTIEVQGYEHKALDLLLMGISEDDIITEASRMPKIMYKFEGKTKRYFPDIFIPSLNLVIEVKSTWTVKQNVEMNDAKFAAAKKNHDFLLLVF